MATGNYGTIRPADPTVDDVEILYCYSPDREDLGSLELNARQFDDNISTFQSKITQLGREIEKINENISNNEDISNRNDSSSDKFKDNIIGIDQEFETPFGTKKMIYADWIASGRLYKPIEERILNDIIQFASLAINNDSESPLHREKKTLSIQKKSIYSNCMF